MNEFDNKYNTNTDDLSDNSGYGQYTSSSRSSEPDMSQQNAEDNTFDTAFGSDSAEYTEPQNKDRELTDTVPQQSADDIFGAQHVRIDLSGGNIPVTPSQANPVYTENILHKKKKGSKRFIAAMVALTVLNLSLFGGAYMLGRSNGMSNSGAASKQALVDNLTNGNSDTPHASEAAKTSDELSTPEIAKQVGPAVVGITSVIQGQMSIFGGVSESASQGSGIILSGDGYIVTNNHVVSGASSVKVLLNTGQEYDAQIIGTDEQTDLAVIKIEPNEELTVAKLGDSTALEVGERVVAIGNPMGLEFFGSVTQGIVSAVNRTISIDNRTMNLIQTDAAINSGNSGGALINAHGEVIGINSVKVNYTGVEGMGFAIPISEANPIIADLLQFGYVKGRPIIGISTRDVNEYMAKSYSWPQGVQVMNVSSDTARDAGLQQGDIITAVNGEKVSTGEELNKIKDKHSPGDVLTLEVYKYSTGKTETVNVTLSEQLPG